MPAISARQRKAQATLRLPEFHSGQQTVVEQLKRFNWLCAGRRWRKTTLGMPLMVVDTLKHGGDYIWGAPTYRQVRVGWDELKAACGDATGAVEFNETRLEVTFPNGAKGHYISLDDPDNARSLTAHRLFIDEVADTPRDAWYSVLRPMLMDTNGWALFGGTPKGRTWFWEEWVKAADRPQDSAHWQIPTVGARVVDGNLERVAHPLENPHVPWSEIVQMFETMPERLFRQEVLAEFLDDAGGVFRGVRNCINGQLLDGPTSARTRYVMGVDLAKSEDYTVCVVVDMEQRRVVAFDRFNRADWGLQKRRIYDLAVKWNNALVWMDATGLGDPIYDDLRAAGMRVEPYKLSNASKTALINNAVLLVEQRSVSYPDIPPLINELSAYQYNRTAAGTITMSAPEGMNDDCVIAASLAFWPLAHQAAAALPTSMLDMMRAPLTELGGIKLMKRNF